MGTRVYVGDLGDHGNQRELEEVFGHYGSLKEVWIAKDPKGFAFVEFIYAEDAATAIKQLDGSMVCGCKVRVENARDSRRGRGGRGGRGFYPRGSTPYRRNSPSSYSRDRRDDRPRGGRDRDVGYYDRDYSSRTGVDNYIGSRRDMYTPPSRGDQYREGPRNMDPYYETSSYRSSGGGPYGSRSFSGYDSKSRDYSPPARRDVDYGYSSSSGPRGYVGSAPSFRDDQHSSYDDKGYSRKDDYYPGGGLSTRNGDKFRYGGRSPMKSPRRSFRDRSPY